MGATGVTGGLGPTGVTGSAGVTGATGPTAIATSFILKFAGIIPPTEESSIVYFADGSVFFVTRSYSTPVALRMTDMRVMLQNSIILGESIVFDLFHDGIPVASAAVTGPQPANSFFDASPFDALLPAGGVYDIRAESAGLAGETFASINVVVVPG